MKVSTLNQWTGAAVKKFCKECEALGYLNNSSLQTMKYEWCKEQGEYWGAWHNEKLISVAGAHPLPEVSENAVRVLFRGCQIQSPHKGLNASHMNSVPFRDILPHQIEMYKENDLYITTNISHDASGHMHKTHRVMQLLEKRGIVDLHIESMNLYNTDQSVWKLNKDRYNEIRFGY
tara:strand:+ start:8074 stop:8601 length:528 start_codon:yes stop_codon:yes gene_type:complete